MFDFDPDTESKVDAFASHLHKDLMAQIEWILNEQIAKIGGCIELNKIKRYVFPEDEKALALYEYDGRKILGVRIMENGLGIVFDVPQLEEPQQKGAGQDVS